MSFFLQRTFFVELSFTCTVLVCEECQDLHYGDCPVHGPLHVILDRREVENANLTAAVSSLPKILSISQSSIPGAGFGVFSNSQIEKGVRFGPYKGEKTGWEHITSETNTSYMWEVKYSFFPLGAVDIFTNSPLNVHWTFRGGRGLGKVKIWTLEWGI